MNPYKSCFFLFQDLLNLGIHALGPRKKIVHALNDMRSGNGIKVSNVNLIDKAKPSGGNKLITEFFRVPRSFKGRSETVYQATTNCGSTKSSKKVTGKKGFKNNSRLRDVPSWCCIPGTPFRVVHVIQFPLTFVREF